MRIFHSFPQCRISPGLLIGLCVLVLIFPLEWVCAWVFAGIVHELAHLAALHFCSVSVFCVEIGLHGARITTGAIPAWKECICAIAGPLSGIILMLVGRWLPQIAVCACLQSIVNLLPLTDFDGGRFVNCLLQIVFAKKLADRVSAVIEQVCIAVLLGIGIYAWIVLKLGFLPLAAVVSLVCRRGISKIPCKGRKQIVQ